MRHIIIPAGGKAVRFGGTLKELLPLNATDTPLLRAIHNASLGLRANIITIITDIPKVTEHMRYISMRSAHLKNIRYMLKTGDELWESVYDALEVCDGGLVLADTVTMVPNIGEMTAPIMFGVFDTTQPERFSLIQDHTILTKPKDMPEGTYKAWGVVLWNKDVANYWIYHMDEVDSYDEAFRRAMDTFGYDTFTLPYYYDLGSFNAYTEYIKEQK